MSDRSGGGSAPSPGLPTLFVAFLKVGALGFGGVAPLARHVLVVERGILDERGFAELFGLSSTLPGANTVNLATLLGDRLGGLRGSLAALAGLLGVPLLVLVAFAGLYDRYGGEADMRVALAGAAAATAGLVGDTALRLLLSLGRTPPVLVPALAVCVAAAGGAPLLAILAAAIPLSIGWQALKLRGQGRG